MPRRAHPDHPRACSASTTEGDPLLFGFVLPNRPHWLYSYSALNYMVCIVVQLIGGARGHRTGDNALKLQLNSEWSVGGGSARLHVAIQLHQLR